MRMNREQKQTALQSIFENIENDGQWHMVVSPYSGYTNLYRCESYAFNNQMIYLIDVRSDNGFSPADRLGIAIADAYGVTFRPATFKKYLHQYMGVENNDAH